ncbi:hypothetical protein F511_10376 [Dorcoceras hygrometricum]|uniref:Uncharacterized protein n=1 Tax=Dorcoceras hygrometricum TaxID=472368 RepID=A0A2Z7CEH0_9LAMI|nr:hypothetical protein F511_10376 [Dorcoceras hygrometricum]
MASSMFTNTYLVDFESVLNIPDNEGMQNMFKALESSGLRGFLGCKSVLYEPELEHFFDTALIQGGYITGVISGKYFSISPSRKIFSKSGVPVVPRGKKKLLKYEYRLLNDILAKSITVKAGSFDAVTTEWFQMMTTGDAVRLMEPTQADIDNPFENITKCCKPAAASAWIVVEILGVHTKESNKNWADSDAETTSSSSSSSDSEQEEVHCLMANQTTEDEVFDISNTEFTREDLINALNEMVHEYLKLSQTFKEIKAENGWLKSSSVEPSTAQLGGSDSLETELSKLKIENKSLRNKSCELTYENERLNHAMSSWTKYSVSLGKLHETQKPLNDKTGLGFNVGESSTGETSTQSDLADGKFKKMNFVKASVTHDTCESVKYDDQYTGQLNYKGKAGIGYTRPENNKSSWLNNRLEKYKAKAGPKLSVPNQQRRDSTKAKSVWVKVQPQRDLNVAKNKNITVEEVADEPVVKKAAPKRRPAPDVGELVVKKKRTTVGRAAPAEKDLMMVSVVKDPEPISVIPAATPRAQRRCAPKRKLMLQEGSDDEIVDSIINQVIADTTEIETGEPYLEEPVVTETTEPVVVEAESRIDVSVTTNDDGEGTLVETDKQADKEKEIEPVATEGMSLEKVTTSEDTEPLSKVLERTVKYTCDEESMSIDDHLTQIPVDMMLPSAMATDPTKIKFGLGIEIPGINEGDWYKASLPQIVVADKEKAPLRKIK